MTKKILKGFLKVIVSISIIAALGFGITYYYLKSTWQNVISEDELTEIVTKVKFAKELPDKFYELYEQEYPGILSKNLNTQIAKGLISNNFVKSPSLLASTISKFTRKDEDSTHISNRKAYTLAWKLEEQTTQKECLNYALENYKFDLFIHGINEIAQYYYKKDVAKLTDRELSDIILLMKEPSIVNVPDRSKEEMH